jgi:hypothetical protein
MKEGEQVDRMPPNSTQNLNAKLSLASVGEQRSGGPALRFAPPPIHSSSPRIKIVSGATHYRGGYHLTIT